MIPHVAGNFLDRNWSEDDNKNFLRTVNNDIVSISKKEVLKFYGMREMYITTVYNWMNILGREYCNNNKKNYFDRHECKNVINSRWKFLKKYLTNKLRIY